MSAHLAAMHLIDPQLVAALGWILLHFVWQGALLGCATAVVLTLLRNARPEARYLAACLGLTLCVAWPAFDLALALGTADGPAGAARGLDRLAGSAIPGDAAGLLGWLQGKLDWIVGLWAACAGALGLRLAAGLAWIGRAVRTEAFDPAWQARLTQLAQRCGLTRAVRLRVVEGLASPVTAGWWRPVVLVPASLLTGMAPQLLEALLAHELGHVKRHDYLVNLLQNVAEALLFYHPAVWWISSRIRLEREQIADDFAARHLGEPRRLALALSELERVQFGGARLAQAANGGDLLLRVRRLLRPSPQALGWQAAIPVLGLAIACAAHAHVNARAGAAPTPFERVTQTAVVDFNSCSKPEYPQADLMAGHTGTVTLKFVLDERGTVQQANVHKSSGYASLDEAARGAIARCSFRPALAGTRPVATTAAVQYVWTLQ
jgi:D-alanyl-D-alanine endopeptidase (penicillin-binding protein 7)